jgi:putative spermidine/putrescine transport system permease protein
MKLSRAIFLIVVALFSLAPILVIVGVSLTASRLLVFPPDQISLRWFAEIFTNSEWFAALVNSVIIALGAAALAVLTALPVVYVAWKRGIRFAKALAALGIVPFILPPIVMAVGFLVFFTALGVEGQLVTAILAHAIYLLAIPIVVLSLGFEAIETSLLEAAATLRADEAQVLRTVILPMILPYVLTAFAFCVVLSMNEYVISLMTIGFTHETVPIRIYNALRYGYSPVLAAVAILFMAINVVIFGFVARLSDLPKLLGAFDR